MSVRTGLVPRWGGIKGIIDKCDMLIQGQIEEKIPLSGHEGAPHGSRFRGGCHFNSRTSIVDVASKREEMMVIRCFCFWSPFMTVRPWSHLSWALFWLEIVVSRQLSVVGIWSLNGFILRYSAKPLNWKIFLKVQEYLNGPTWISWKPMICYHRIYTHTVQSSPLHRVLSKSQSL